MEAPQIIAQGVIIIVFAHIPRCKLRGISSLQNSFKNLSAKHETGEKRKTLMMGVDGAKTHAARVFEDRNHYKAFSLQPTC